MLIYRLSYLKAGLDPQTSQEIAEKVTQSPDRVLEDVIDIMNNEDIETPSKEQIEELKNDYFEAISSYGEIAEDVLVANEELKNLIQTRGGKSEDEAKEIAHKYGLMVAKDFQIAKDNGYEGSFNEFKNEHYKLNGITDFSNDTAPVNENIKETSIEEQEDIWKEVEREKAVQLQEGIDRYMEESQPAKLYSFGGENAEGGKVLNNLNTAKALFEEGVDNEEIRQQTGWFKGVDNKWRFEINDEKAEFNKGYNPDEWKKNGVVFNGLNFSLGKILKHDELYEVYPWLRHITVQYTSRMDELGGLDNGYRTIYLNSKQNADELKSVLMHEIQHLIQRREDFARGGSPYEFASKEYLDKEVDRTKSRLDKAKEALAVADDLGYDDSALYDGFTILEYKTNLPLYESSYNEAVKDRENYVAEPFEAYQRLGGETEARNVQSRLKLTDEERRNTPIEETQDIKNEDLIIKFSSGREFAYNAGVTKKTIQKAREVKSALQKIANGSEEETVVNLRDDLEQFGGTNDVTFIYGNDKKGIYHIAEVHGIKTLLRVFDTVIDGSVARFVKNKKTVILEKNGIEAVLSLDENGNKKTWLLTGWNTKISPDEEREFRATLKSTQEEPTFSRQILGAELSNLNITPSDEDVNTKLYSREEGSERPYSNRQLDRMLDNAEENKEALIDLYYNHRHKYLAWNGNRLERQVTDPEPFGWGLEKSDWDKKRRKAIAEEKARIDDIKQRMDDLKIPKNLSPNSLKKLFENSGYKILREYKANTGSYYLTVENKVDGEDDIHISIRDHFKHSNDYVETDYDIYVDRDYNWTSTILHMADELGLEGTLITKLRKYNDLMNELKGTEGVYYSETEGNILGSYDEKTKEVELFKGQNPSTLMHELSHHFLLSHIKLMEKMGLYAQNKAVFEWLSEKGGHEIRSYADITRADKENLTEAFIDYMNRGIAPNIVTKNIFKRTKEWIIEQYKIHKTKASKEIRQYFDNLISEEGSIPDMSGITSRVDELKEILRQAKNGEEVSFKGLGKQEVRNLKKAINTRIRRKGKTLRDEIIEAGGIKEGTELANSLGFDVLKKDKMFSNKEYAFEREDELIEFLAEKGFITPIQEEDDYKAIEDRWSEVQRLIDKAYLPIIIGGKDNTTHLMVREDNQGNFFWDAQIKGKFQHATPITNPEDTELSNLNITPSDENVKTKLYSM